MKGITVWCFTCLGLLILPISPVYSLKRQTSQRRKDFPTLFYPGPDKNLVTLAPHEIPVSSSSLSVIGENIHGRDLDSLPSNGQEQNGQGENHHQIQDSFPVEVNENAEFSNDVLQVPQQNLDGNINQLPDSPVHIIYVRPGSEQSPSLFDNSQGFSDHPVEPQETQFPLEFQQSQNGDNRQNGVFNGGERPRHGDGIMHSRRRPHANALTSNRHLPKALRPYPVRLKLKDLISPPAPSQLMQMLHFQRQPETHRPPPTPAPIQQTSFQQPEVEQFEPQQPIHHQQIVQEFPGQQESFQPQNNEQLNFNDNVQIQQHQGGLFQGPVQETFNNNNNDQFTQPAFNEQEDSQQSFQHQAQNEEEPAHIFAQPQDFPLAPENRPVHQQPRRRPHLLEQNDQQQFLPPPPDTSFNVQRDNMFDHPPPAHEQQNFIPNDVPQFIPMNDQMIMDHSPSPSPSSTNDGSLDAFFGPTKTGFSCRDQPFPGYYADVEAGCQMFHVCYAGSHYTFHCPNGTLFDQKYLVCNWPHSVNCGRSADFVQVNEIFMEERRH